MIYRIFGLPLACDVPLPELPRMRACLPEAVVRVRTRARIPRDWQWIDRWERGDGVAWLRIGKRDDGWRLQFPSLADFIVAARDTTITCTPRGRVPPRSIRHLLIDQVVPLAFSARGHVLLHASAVATPSGALLFAGPSGSGKSTLAFALARGGAALLSDDIVRIDANGPAGAIAATPAYPGARLWPDVLDAVRADRGRQLAHYSRKRRVSSARRAGAAARPLARVYLLSTGNAPAVKPVPPRAALVELLKHTYRLDVTDAGIERHHFETLASLCAAVPVRTLIYPHELTALEEVVRKVMADVQ